MLILNDISFVYTVLIYLLYLRPINQGIIHAILRQSLFHSINN